MRRRIQGNWLLHVLYQRPFDFLVAIACILTGAKIVLDGDATPSSIGALPDVVTMIYRVLLLVAGLMFMAGLLKRRPSAMERSGLWLAATAFVAYGLAAVFSGINAQATFAIILVFCMSAACALRALGIAYESKARLQALQEAPRKGQAHE